MICPEFGVDTPVLISKAPGTQFGPVSASHGRDFLVVWLDGRKNVVDDGLYGSRIYGTRVRQDGAVLDAVGFAISDSNSGGIGPFAVASNGSDCFVLRLLGSSLVTTMVTKDGLVSDLVGTAVQSQLLRGSLSIAFNGSEFLAVRMDARKDYRGDVYGARFSRDGRILDADAFPICTLNAENSKRRDEKRFSDSPMRRTDRST